MAKKQKKQYKKPRSRKFDFLIIGVILVIALMLRIYKLDIPLADWHSWRQADTAAVARNFVRDGFDLLRTRYDDLSSIQTGLHNPEGLRFVEFPLYNTIFASAYKYLPVVPIELYGRLVSIIASLFLISIIYYLVLKEEGRISAAFSALIFAIMPFFVYYSRVILPEMSAITLMFASILFMYLYSKKPKEKSKQLFYLVISAVFAALAILTKPTAGFYGITIMYLFFKRFKWNVLKQPSIFLYGAIALAPFILWRLWMLQFPEGIPASEWLITNVNTSEGVQNIFFRPSYFRWIFHERIANLILGGYLVVFLVLGFLKKHNNFLFISLGVSSAAFLLTFQGGNLQHDYYQTIILPTIAIFTGIGIGYVIEKKQVFPYRWANLFTIAVILAFSFFFSYFRVKDYYNYSSELVSVAKIINTLTPEDALIVTDRTGDTTLLYLSDRKGYPAVTEDLHNLKKKGMDFFVTDKPDVAEKVKREFELIFENEHMFLFKL
ncbi:MAG: glycosyltransferase family 39 protein [Candidatus Paceibacterota bacterium]